MCNFRNNDLGLFSFYWTTPALLWGPIKSIIWHWPLNHPAGSSLFLSLCLSEVLLTEKKKKNGIPTIHRGPGIKQFNRLSVSQEAHQTNFHANKILFTSLPCTTRIERSWTKGKQVNKQNDVWTCHCDEYVCKLKLIFLSFLFFNLCLWCLGQAG